MTLESILQSSDFSGLTAEEALDLLLTASPGSGDSTPYTWSGFSQRLLAIGVSAEVVLSLPSLIPTLTGGTLFDRCLASGGFDFSDPTNRSLVAQAKSGASAETIALLDAMLAIGADRKLWQVLGLESEPTIDQIEIEQFASLCTLIASRLRTGQINSITSAKQALS